MEHEQRKGTGKKMAGRLVLSSDSILETGSVSWEVQNKVRDACAFL